MPIAEQEVINANDRIDQWHKIRKSLREDSLKQLAANGVVVAYVDLVVALADFIDTEDD